MTVRELIIQLENFDDDMCVVIGRQPMYGRGVVVEIESCAVNNNVIAYGGEECSALVITGGNKLGIIPK